MRLYRLLFSLLFLSTCKAAEQPQFYFLTAPAEIKDAIGTPSLTEKIVKMNVESRYFEISKSALEPETIQQYIRSQEEISSLLYQNCALIDLMTPEIKEFTGHLLKSFDQDADKFTGDKLLDIFSIFIASGTPENEAKIKSVFVKNLKRLEPIQRPKLLERLIKHASTETTFVIPSMLTKTFLSSESIKSFLDDYIRAIFAKIPAEYYSNYIHCFSKNIMCVSKTKQVLDKSTYELLLAGLKAAIVNIKSNWHESILSSLNLLFDKISDHPSLVQLIIDIVLHENIVSVINSEEFNENMMQLLIKFSKFDYDYFKSALKKLPMEVLENMEAYMKQLKSASLALICVANLRNLTADSDERQYKLVISSAKNLRKLYKTCPDAINSIPNFSNILKLTCVGQAPVFKNYDHPLNAMSLKVIFYLALIDFDMSKESQRIEASGNISYSLGHLMVKSKKTDDFPIELVDEVLPIIDEVMANVMKLKKTLTRPMTAIDLKAHIRFANLHHSAEIVKSATDQLCLILLTSMPIKSKGYLYVRDLEYTDEAGIAVTGFLYYVEEYLKAAAEREEVKHFKDYFDHLIQKRFLNKSQQLSIRRIFKNFT